MNFQEVTAFCGIDCWNCQMFHTNLTDEMVEYFEKKFNKTREKISCLGCKTQGGCPLMGNTCKTRECVTAKGLDFCGDCDEFPCKNLHPAADGAERLPHNYKVYNLCSIKRLGVEKWAEQQATDTRKRYFEGKMVIGSGPQLQ